MVLLNQTQIDFVKWALGVMNRSIFKQNFIIRLTGVITKRKREELIFDL